MLGHDLMDVIPRAGHHVVGMDLPEIDITYAGSVADALDSFGLTWSSTPPHTLPSTRQRSTRTSPCASTAKVRVCWRRRSRSVPASDWCTSVRTTSSPETQVLLTPRIPRRRPDRPTVDQIGGRGRGSDRSARSRVHRANRLALRGERQQLCRSDHAHPGGDQARDPGGGRPVRAADLEPRPGNPDCGARGFRSPGGHLPRDLLRGDDVVRVDEEVYPVLSGPTPEGSFRPPPRRSPRPAPRPAYSVLGHERWAEVGLAPIRDWREALEEFLSDQAASRGRR